MEPKTPGDVFRAFTDFMTDLASRMTPQAEFAPSAPEPSTLPSGVPVQVTDVADALMSVSYLRPLGYAWEVYVPIALFFMLLMGAGCLYCLVRIIQIRRLENMRFAAAARTVATKDVSRTQLRWQRILEQISKDDEHAWRLAILEAYIMLNELLDVQGYRGETMADKMKSVDRSNFTTIDMAWEAHKVRNKIAHEGSEHSLTHREARRVIDMYANVFREFKIL